jgi:hypothetical protein
LLKLTAASSEARYSVTGDPVRLVNAATLCKQDGPFGKSGSDEPPGRQWMAGEEEIRGAVWLTAGDVAISGLPAADAVARHARR